VAHLGAPWDTDEWSRRRSAVDGNGGSDSGTMNSTSVMMMLASVLQRVDGPTFLVQDEIGVR
jgi:hypothetical protein